ncbi:hypothetical protein AAFF_G00131890 [Aldrovandia affinis]|uniref:Reverse transcriptase RNase H-like domain-containing protein n=1 Tax=Aldrovandia affinis TaxID=143900 RepID=A0AAD7RQS4_9TELE|nr:hypothetical protein AAFF_G00131890 [Aldrovandia affinis]
MANYLGRFVPNLVARTANLQKLLQAKIEFVWTKDHEREWEHAKRILAKEPVLTFFHLSRQTKVILETDHKPLIAISRKSLNDTSVRIQRMMMRRLQTYDVVLVRKAAESFTDPCLALLAYRAAPLEAGKSPAETLMGRKLRTRLPNLDIVDNTRDVCGRTQLLKTNQKLLS